MVEVFGVMVTEGAGLTTTLVLTVALQPAAETRLRLYVPLCAGDAFIMLAF
jgi:hypothetical protein